MALSPNCNKGNIIQKKYNIVKSEKRLVHCSGTTSLWCHGGSLCQQSHTNDCSLKQAYLPKHIPIYYGPLFKSPSFYKPLVLTSIALHYDTTVRDYLHLTTTRWTFHIIRNRCSHRTTKTKKSSSEKFHFGDSLICKSKFNSSQDLCKSKLNSLPLLCKSKLNSLLDLYKSNTASTQILISQVFQCSFQSPHLPFLRFVSISPRMASILSGMLLSTWK